MTVAAVNEHRRVVGYETASAACNSAVQSKVSGDEATDLDSWHSYVTRQGSGWSVDGQLPSTGRDATCLVVPDPTNHLRGVRVDSVRLTPPNGG